MIPTHAHSRLAIFPLLFGMAAGLFWARAASEELPEITALAGKQLLFVVGDRDATEESDDPAIKEYLESLGLEVRRAAGTGYPEVAAEIDLIVISSTANARELGGLFRQSPIPVLTWNAYMYPQLGMTGDVLHEDFSVVREAVTHNLNHASFYSWCTNRMHPIAKAAGLPNGMFLALMFAGETDMNWGRPTAGADVIAISVGNPSHAAAFVYEKGALMHGDFASPARRAGIFLGDDSFRLLSYAEGPAAADPKQKAWFSGRPLFEATLRWTLGRPVERSLETPQLRQALTEQARGRRVLFLRRENLPWPAGEASDAAHLAFLRSHGFTVDAADQTAPEMKLEDYDLIIISATTNKYKFGTKYADAELPVVLLEGKSVDSMNMAGPRRWTDYGTNDNKNSLYPPEAYVKVMRPFHGMAGGFDAGLVRMYEQPGLITWSIPAPGATIAATIPNQPRSAAIYGYEKGVAMANGAVAPAKRALFPVDYDRFHHLSADGLALYRGVLLWSLSD